MQMTIRNISAQLRGKLEAAARRRGVSLNQAAIEAMATGLGVVVGPAPKRDLSDIAGTMTRDDARAIGAAVARSDAGSLCGQEEDEHDANRRRHEPIRRPRRRIA